MNRIILVLLALLCPRAAVVSAEDPSKLNILLICVDDLRPELGCYGVEHAISPNIDRLSASGVTFDNCHVQVAVCNPSRASLMTGLRPDTLKCWTLRYHFRETSPDATTLPQYLRQHGYRAEGYGKIFHNPWQDPRSWDRPHRFGPGDWTHYTDAQKDRIREIKERLPGDHQFKSHLRGLITNSPDIEDSEHPDGAMTDIVVGRLAALKDSDEPFFLAAGFVLPHLPWCPPKRYWDMYERESLPLSSNATIPENAPPVALGTSYEFRHYADAAESTPAPMDGTVSPETARKYIHGYLASITYVDAQIGRILDALDDQGLSGNTAVLLWSDHGYKLGDHNGWGKMTNFEIDTRVPFLIRDPRARANGQRCGQLVETLDIFPTICEIAGDPAPEFTEGKSAAHLLDTPEAEHTGAAFSQYVYPPLIGNSIRTPDWRYTEWREMKDGSVAHRELYDRRGKDHLENRNLIGEYLDEERELQEKLSAVIPAKPVTLLPVVRSAKGGERTTLKFLNRHPGTVRLSWISPGGERAQVFDVKKGATRTINSFAGHVFVAESLDGKYHETITAGADSEPIELGAARREVREIISPIPEDRGIPAFYQQLIEVEGYPIVASENVSPYAVREAAWVVGGMLENRADLLRAMTRSGSRLSIIGHNEFTTDLPEFANLRKPRDEQFAKVTDREYWDVRARGTGGSRHDPFCSCAEENLLTYPGDPYKGECILIHEFAHCIHWRGLMELDSTFNDRLLATYQAAVAAGLWQGTYAGTNHAEYFAEGVQSWFNDNRENDKEHNHVNTRAELKAYDPGLAALIEEVFRDTPFEYSPPGTRLRGHLEGFDPKATPSFSWPDRLQEAFKIVFEKPMVLPVKGEKK